jgi:hypothetical protein
MEKVKGMLASAIAYGSTRAIVISVGVDVDLVSRGKIAAHMKANECRGSLRISRDHAGILYLQAVADKPLDARWTGCYVSTLPLIFRVQHSIKSST